METRQQKTRSLPNSLTESSREARREARDAGTLRGWWRRAIGDVRDLLAAAKCGGDEVTGNLEVARNILLHLCLIAGTRVSIGCSCNGSKVLEATLVRVADGLIGAKSDIERALSILNEERLDGESNDHRTSNERIALALIVMPNLAQIGRLARDLGYCDPAEHTTIPVVRDGRTWCRFCGSGLGHPDGLEHPEPDQHAQAEREAQEVRPPLSLPDLQRLTGSVWAAIRAGGCDDTLRHTCASLHKRGWPVEAVVTWLRAHGGYCDCEVVLNVEQHVAHMAA